MLSFLAIPAIAQDDELDGFSFETEPLRSEKMPYFAIGAGYQFSFLFMNYDEVNKIVVDKLGLDKFEGFMYINGIHGFTGLVIIPNTRLGFFGVSGSKISEKEIVNNLAEKELHSAELSISFNGFSLDYGFVPLKGLAILPGFNLGWGRYILESSVTPITIDYSDLANLSMQRIENSFMFVEPQISIEYAITNFAMIKANAGYSLTFDNPLAKKKWLLNNNAEIKNAPKDMNANGFKAQIGVYLGLFNY